MPVIKTPNRTQRITIVGATGTGKTIAGFQHLFLYRWEEFPFIIVDFKRDMFVTNLIKLGIPILNYNSSIPKRGLAVIQPNPHEMDELDDYLWKIHARQRCGIFLDEGMMMKRGNALLAIYTQGRSLQIPVITLSQRPVGLRKEAFSEADYIQVFNLRMMVDQKTVAEYIPGFTWKTLQAPLKPFFSWYCDQKSGSVIELGPSLDEEDLLAAYRRRLIPKRHII